MCNLGDPGKSHLPARFFLLQFCQLYWHTSGRGISCCYQLLFKEVVRWIPEHILCESYVVKIWEGMVQNSLSCDTIPKRWECVLFWCPFSIVHYLQYCMLEDSSTKCEMHDMYICVSGMHGKTLVGIDHIGTEILMSVSQ